MSNHSITLIFTISILLLSCNKEKKSPTKQGNMWDCHHELHWNPSITKKALIGEWEWEYIDCFWNPEKANGDDFKGLTIEFKSDNSLNVKQNGVVIQTSNWKVIKGDADLFALDVDPTVPQLYGRILFCDNRVVFNDSYIDGCDNFFIKKK